jgi:hypothetical protein
MGVHGEGGVAQAFASCCGTGCAAKLDEVLVRETVLRAVIVAAALAASSSSGAIAAGCSPELQDRWAASTQEMQRLHQVAQLNTMKPRADKDILCTFARLVPSFLKTAREYFAACDPDGGTRAMADLEALFRSTPEYERAGCGK